MPPGIFVTGGSGFVGRRLLAALQALERPVVALDRSGSLPPLLPGLDRLTVVRGDLLEPDTYLAALRSCDVVIHLAAATGRAPAREHERVNVRGTEVLLEACHKAGVAKIVFVSTIATTFPENIGYPYAGAKRRAEEAVSRSGLRFTILRPTIILGSGAPNLKALERLALLPFVVVPGNGRVRVQPIQVDDVARSITETIRLDRFANETVEIGGPDVLTMEGLLQQLRVARTGKSGRVLHIPLGLLHGPLTAAEALGLGRLLPVTSGQLSSFRFDGVAVDRRSSVDGLVEAECRVFTRYLLGCEPDDYVIGKYGVAHDVLPALAPAGQFDEWLLAFGRVNSFCARIADSYAGLFFRTAALRKRLVLLLAILETRPPFHQTMDKAIGGSMLVLLVRLGLTTAGSLLSLAAGTVILAPARMVLALVGRGPR